MIYTQQKYDLMSSVPPTRIQTQFEFSNRRFGPEETHNLYHHNSSRIPIKIPIRTLLEFWQEHYRDSGQNLSEYCSEFFKNPNKNSSWLLIGIIRIKIPVKICRNSNQKNRWLPPNNKTTYI